MQRLNEWPNVYGALNDLQAEIGQDCYDCIYDGRLPAAHIVPAVRVSVLEKIWKELVTADESLSRLDAFTLDRNLNIFRTEDRNRREIAKAEVLHSYSNGRPTGSVGQMGVIRQELEKKTRLFPVRKLMNRAGEAVHLLKPVFLMSPMSIAQFLEPGSVTFDLLLIDEASQIRPEDALGAIARAKQVVVVGDSKQLPPTNFFSRLSDDEANPVESDEEGNHFLEDVESVLGLCSGIFKSNLMLRWHYRSRHPGLIAVSNRHFYENKLMMPPSVLLAQSSKNLGVSFVASPPNSYQRGGSDGGRNVAEAELIAQEVIAFAKANPIKSLGVAAFSVKQRDAIRDLIDEYRTKNPKLEPFFSLTRKEPFFVKNLESIQGDERDVIFISVGYGRSSDGRLTQTFGPLGADGGERRLNVLISRAKERCTVFSSITAEDVRAVPGKLGVNAFREFLQFAKNGYFDVPVDSGRDFDSDFEESIATFLLANGYEVKPQVGMVGFFIDIGVVDPNAPDRFLCGIECDGATYHSSRSARDRDRLRQDILEARGWSIYRIWSTDWFHRRQEQEQRLLDYLVALQNGESAVPTEVPGEVPSPIIYETPVTPAGEGVVIGTGVEATGNVQPYKEYQPDYTYSGEPHEQPFEVLKDLVKKIVACEGPIHIDEVAKRVATCHRLERAGARIKRVTEDALRGSTELKNDRVFWRLATGGELVVRDRSRVTSNSLKSAEFLPPAEIDLALCLIIKGGVRVEEVELMQHTAKMFGFLRCGPDLKQVIKVVLESNVSGRIRSEGSVYSLR
jgi:very-short-patch-repair endonuclease